MTELTTSQLRRALRLARYGYSARAIAVTVKANTEDVRNALARMAVCASASTYQKPKPKVKAAPRVPAPWPARWNQPLGIVAPVHSYRNGEDQPLFAERERRQTAARQQSLTATLFGDPPPGYSALDKKNSGAAS